MTIRTLVTTVGIVLLLANPGWAQSSTTTTGSFDSLSPGNQKIANALFSAQDVKGTTLTPLTKNQIADLKGTEGWGKVFKEMKADGLIQAKNLGQVVSQHEHSLHTSTTSTASRSSGRSTTRTSTRTGSRVSSAGITNGRGVTTGSHAMGASVATNATGGFGHGGMGGGFGGGGGHGGGHGR